MIDLRSDTQTRPTAAMRAAIARADVGDEQLDEDPTLRALETRVADMLGHEAALFAPSGSMANQLALLALCRPGDAAFVHETSHLIHAEAGAPCALAGVVLRPLPGEDGAYAPETLAEAVAASRGRNAPLPRLAAIEQTANYAGGAVWPLASVRAVAAEAKAQGMATHMDGARLFNACVAANLPPRAFAEPMTSVMVDFSKGLGCPVGAALAGSAALIEDARRWKKRLGGAMRQTGILAAAALYALDAHIARLADDHANARALAEALAEAPGVSVKPPATNIVLCALAPAMPDAQAVCDALGEAGVGASPVGARAVRLLTHLDIAAADVPRAAEKAKRVFAGLVRKP